MDFHIISTRFKFSSNRKNPVKYLLSRGKINIGMYGQIMAMPAYIVILLFQKPAQQHFLTPPRIQYNNTHTVGGEEDEA